MKNNRGSEHRILKDGTINCILKDGTSIINGHISIIDNKEVAKINGYIFELSELNITQDFRIKG